MPEMSEEEKRKMEEKERKKAEVRRRLEEASKAKKSTGGKGGFMTPERKKKLRALLRKKAADELKKEQERKAEQRRTTIAQRCGNPKSVDTANEDQRAHYPSERSSWQVRQTRPQESLQVRQAQGQSRQDRSGFPCRTQASQEGVQGTYRGCQARRETRMGPGSQEGGRGRG